MGTSIQDSWPPVTEAEIAEFEKELGYPLPADYREFLLKHNGGFWPDPMQYRASQIRYLYGFVGWSPWCDLRAQLAGWIESPVTPRGTMPITEALTYPIFLCLTGCYRNQLFKWDYEAATELHDDVREQEKWKIATTRWARTFTDFVDGLKPVREPPVSAHPIFQAVENDDVDSVRQLLDSGVPTDIRMTEEWSESRTLLAWAVGMGRLEITRLLIDRGADVEAQDDNGWPVAFYTSRNQGRRSSDAARMLLRHGVSPNARDRDGWPWLLFAVKNEATTILPPLIEAGADVTVRDGDGHGLYWHCQQARGYGDEMWNFLEAAGAKRE